LPVFIDGRNSAAFQLMGCVHPRLRTASLAKEFVRKQGAEVEVRIGNKLPAGGLQLPAASASGPAHSAAGDRKPTASTGTEFLRWKTYLLANRAAKGRANASKPAPEEDKTAQTPRSQAAKLPLIPFLSAPEALADAVPRAQLEREIALLPSPACLDNSEEYGVYCAHAAEIPHILREIGRLRELSFRAEGEGTGKSVDLDRYDDYYTHLFVWNKPQKEIVGAYRLARTVDIRRKFGVNGLYTNTLFRFKDDFFDLLGPAIELGRSFVRPEYQRQYAPLLLLWKAIGRYVALNPAFPVLFGAVSISNSYAPASRTLMYQFFQAQFATHPLAAMVQPRRPFRSARLKHWDISAFNRLVRDPAELSGSISEFEFDGKGIPVLLKQYLKMGGEVLAFNVDGRFSDTLDGLIVVDLRKSDRKAQQKYLGSEGATRFIDYHRELSLPEFVAEPAD
ncbi:MAG: glycerol acyltransferase, partial [Acidobacteria bacterium]